MTPQQITAVAYFVWGRQGEPPAVQGAKNVIGRWENCRK